MNRVTPADLLLVLVACMWGTNFSVIKVGLSDFDPMVFNSIRFVLAVASMAAIALALGQSLRFKRSDLKWILGLGILGNTVYQTLFIIGANWTTAGNTALILATPPVFIAVMGSAFGLERISLLGWLGIAVSLAGVVTIVLGSSQSTPLEFGGATLRGDVAIFAATFVWSLFTVLLRPVVKLHSPVKVTVLTTAFGAVPFLALATPSIAATDFGAITPRAWVAVVVSSQIGVSFPYFLWNYGVQKLGSARTALYSYLTPLIAVVVAWFWIGETMTLLQGAGGVLILVGVVVARRYVRAPG